MPIAVADIVTRAGHILQDEDNVRWTVDELIEWINDAAAAIIVIRPSARGVISTITLVAGTKQQLDTNVVTFLDMIRNIGADGSTPGRATRRVDRQLLDDQFPNWHAMKPGSQVRHFAFDERAPQTVYVFPPVKAGVKVEVLNAETPPAVSAIGDTLDMQDQWMNSLVEYVLYRAMSKDSEYADGNVAAAHFTAFAAGVGQSSAQTTANSPNANSV